MKTEKRRAFIIHFLYFIIILSVSFTVIKYALPMLSSFVIPFIIKKKQKETIILK